MRSASRSMSREKFNWPWMAAAWRSSAPRWRRRRCSNAGRQDRQDRAPPPPSGVPSNCCRCCAMCRAASRASSCASTDASSSGVVVMAISPRFTPVCHPTAQALTVRSRTERFPRRTAGRSRAPRCRVRARRPPAAARSTAGTPPGPGRPGGRGRAGSRAHDLLAGAALGTDAVEVSRTPAAQQAARTMRRQRLAASRRAGAKRGSGRRQEDQAQGFQRAGDYHDSIALPACFPLMNSPLTHFDPQARRTWSTSRPGRDAPRGIRATGTIRMQPATFALVASGQAKKAT